MCGNGIRCFANLLRDHNHISKSEVNVETGAGILGLKLGENNEVSVDMGIARFTRSEIGMTGDPISEFIEQTLQGRVGTAVSMGNPHLVIFVEDVRAVVLEIEGPKLERDELFSKRTNVHFGQIIDRGHLIERTWERGAGATLACGTGACATGAAAVRTGRADAHMQIDLPGGTLKIDVSDHYEITMTGPAKTSFTGEWPES